MSGSENLSNARVIIIQKLYSHHINRETKIIFPKHRYKKFIKDVVNGTIERDDLIKEILNKDLKNEINDNKTELIIKIMVKAAIYEFTFMHKIPIKVIISEYLKASDLFVQSSQKSFLNAILDKLSKSCRVSGELHD
tara:strand:+ start:1822 stop:2232 length:411 start_codon:yes stop_codon:yes gene_type:complete